MRELQQRLRAAERDVERLTNQIAEAQKKAGDDKLAMYRHHSALVSKKLQQKEADLEEAERELAEVNRDIEDNEAKISEMAGPKFMGREEFKRYDSQLREKVNKYRKLKAELNEIEHETVIVTRTVAVRRVDVACPAGTMRCGNMRVAVRDAMRSPCLPATLPALHMPACAASDPARQGRVAG